MRDAVRAQSGMKDARIFAKGHLARRSTFSSREAQEDSYFPFEISHFA